MDRVVDHAGTVGRDEGRAQSRTRTVRIELSLRSVFSLLAIAIGLWLLVQLWQILLLLVVALVLAGTLSPLVDGLERRRLGRPLALVLVLVALLLVLVGIAAAVLPALAEQVGALVAGAPEVQRRLAEALAQFPPLTSGAGALREATPDQFLAPVGAYALRATAAAAEVVALGVTTVVLAFYLLADRERMLGFAYALLPRSYHLRTGRILLDLQMIVGGYVRGQALTSVLIGLFVFVVLWAVGTPNPLALALIAAFTDLIPFIGGWIALAPATLATLPLGLWPTALVFAAIFAYQEFESRVLIPRVYGHTLRLSPVAVTLALLIGFQLLGIAGALLALPLAAGIRVLVEDLRIDLPGEHTAEPTERAAEARAEAVYAERTEGATAIEAAAVATELAEQRQAAQEVATGSVEVPIEERADGDPARPVDTTPRG